MGMDDDDDTSWTNRFRVILEKGTLDAIYLSGDGHLESTVREFERILQPGGILISVSGVVPEDVRRYVFQDWNWLEDGSDDLKAGCFVLQYR
jgi:SAM-dependent methyltransferase